MLTTLAKNEKYFETESFSIFCLEATGLQHTLIELLLKNGHFKV
jgi:hypothetical protein